MRTLGETSEALDVVRFRLVLSQCPAAGKDGFALWSRVDYGASSPAELEQVVAAFARSCGMVVSPYVAPSWNVRCWDCLFMQTSPLLRVAPVLLCLAACDDGLGHWEPTGPTEVAAPPPAGEPDGGGVEVSTRDGARPAGGFAIRVDGNHFVDGSGAPVQLRGYNVSGLEYAAIQGSADPWGGQFDTKNLWTTIKGRSANAVRIPLNAASWLGYACTGDKSGALVPNRNPDPGGNYKATVAAAVSGAIAAGLYVILDMHIAGPAPYCPQQQTFLPDADHAVEFWKSVAFAFKGNDAVLFELFNEPISGPANADAVADWKVLRDGAGTMNAFSLLSAGGSDMRASWKTVGMQALVDAIRGTGADNVILAAGLMWARSFTSWLAYRPMDPLNQLGAVWHVYAFNGVDTTYNEPAIFDQAQAILDAGIPIAMTEMADSGGKMVQRLTDWADAHSVSYFAWAWNSWANPGPYFQTHLSACGAKTVCK